MSSSSSSSAASSPIGSSGSGSNETVPMAAVAPKIIDPTSSDDTVEQRNDDLSEYDARIQLLQQQQRAIDEECDELSKQADRPRKKIAELTQQSSALEDEISKIQTEKKAAVQNLTLEATWKALALDILEEWCAQRLKELDQLDEERRQKELEAQKASAEEQRQKKLRAAKLNRRRSTSIQVFSEEPLGNEVQAEKEKVTSNSVGSYIVFINSKSTINLK